MLYLPIPTDGERRGGRGPLPTQHTGRHLTRMFCSAPKLGSWRPKSYRCGLLEGFGPRQRANEREGRRGRKWRRGARSAADGAVKRGIEGDAIGKKEQQEQETSKTRTWPQKAAASTSYMIDQNSQSRMVQGFPAPAMARRIGMHHGGEVGCG